MKSNIEFLYEELRKATDGGSESMTHDDALKQIAYWRDKCSQSQAVEPVATVQCINGVTIGYLDVMQPVGTKLYTHPVPPPAGERAELIAGIKHELAEFAHNKTLETLLLDAADMLEADVSLINEGNKAQQVAVPAREPLTFEQIDAIENKVYMNTTHKGRPMFEYVNAIIRAVEAHHSIGAKLVTKQDSRPQNCGTGHCSCIDCPYPKPDWSAA